MASDPEKDSEPGFSCKFNLDLKIRERSSFWPWLVALGMTSTGAPFLWRLFERLLGSVG